MSSSERPTQDTTPYRPGEAARKLGVSTRTVYRMGEDGTLRFNQLPSGHRRYDRESVDALAEGGDSK